MVAEEDVKTLLVRGKWLNGFLKWQVDSVGQSRIQTNEQWYNLFKSADSVICEMIERSHLETLLSSQ